MQESARLIFAISRWSTIASALAAAMQTAERKYTKGPLRRPYTRNNPRQRYRDSYSRLRGTRDSPRQTRNRAQGGEAIPKNLKPPFLGPPGPQEAPGSPQGVPRDHTDPYGSIRIHKNPYRPLPDQFPKVILPVFDDVWKILSKKWPRNKKWPRIKKQL